MYRGSDIRREKNPRQDANVFSILSFAYTLGIFKKSKKAELLEDDLYDVVDNSGSSGLGDQMEEVWKVEGAKGHPSLTRALWRMFGKEYTAFGLFNVCFRCIYLAIKPLSLGRLVAYFIPNSDLDIYDALFHASVIVLSSLAFSNCKHYYGFGVGALALRLRVALCSLMYRKSLRLREATLRRVTNGKIVTMMSKDVQFFEAAMYFGHDLWIGVGQLAVMTYVMYGQIGASAFIGVAILFMFSPLQIWLGTIAKSVRLKCAAQSDIRLRRIQEVLTSIKLIKFYTWEPYFTRLIGHFRRLEIRKLRQIYWIKAVILGSGNLGHKLSLFLCIVTYSLFGNALTTEKAFVVASCYQSVHFACVVGIPMCVIQFAQAKSAMKRIKEYLLVEELDERRVDLESKAAKVRLSYGGLDFRVDEGEVVGVAGDIGSGKSTLLKMVIGEVETGDGVEVQGGLSYASQEPWLFPATIRENILFGNPYDADRYETVVRVCALNKDLEALPDNDRTVVTDNGVNLSKGQQARINLARAVYKDCGVYLLDDILSSLDAKVAGYVFEECILRFLAGKLRVMVSHNKRFLAKVDRVIVLEKGAIRAEGSVDQINFERGDVDSAMAANVVDDADENSKLLVTGTHGGAKVHIYGEHKQEGGVTWKTYKTYFTYAGGWRYIPLVLVLCFAVQGLSVYFDYYLTVWIKVEDRAAATGESEERNKAMLIYNGIIVAYVASLVAELVLFFGLATRASVHLHNGVFSKVMNADMRFFDTFRTGTILNRLSKDMSVVDECLPPAFFETIRALFSLITKLVAVISTGYIFAVPSLLLLVVLLYARKVFLKTSRSLKRLEGMTRAPMVGYLNTTLDGLATIRAAGNQEVLIRQFDHHQDLNTSAAYMYISVLRGFAYWLDVICHVFSVVIIATFLFLHGRTEIFAANVGLALTQSFGLTQLLQWGIRQWSEVENTTTSVERVAHYMKAPQEPPPSMTLPNIPTHGGLKYKDVSMKYSNSKTYALRNVSFDIPPGQKVGVIGRTGAGKSSIVSALFQLYPVEGAIEIDGRDIRHVDLRGLRSKISIIPQDPVMFEGTIRTNLDPVSTRTDEELWKVLDQARLKHLVDDLDGIVDDGGANFSAGQRQLFCLARALLRNNKILVLDEATSNVDPNTDALIQEKVGALFEDCTVLTIAHKISTVMGCDRIMVVEDGRVVEMEDPKVLLARGSGVFYNLAKQSGLC